MSTIYNPLASEDAFLSSFGDEAPQSNGLAPASGSAAPSLLNQATKLTNDFSDQVVSGMNPFNMKGTSTGIATLLGLPVSRIVAIILGLLLIGGGIIMFRPELGETVTTAAKAAVVE